MRQKYSGKATNSAPSRAASAIKWAACCRLSDTWGWLTICSMAVRIGGSLSGFGLGAEARRYAGDLRLQPGAVDEELLGGRLRQRAAQDPLGQEGGQAHHGVDGGGDQRGAASVDF